MMSIRRAPALEIILLFIKKIERGKVKGKLLFGVSGNQDMDYSEIGLSRVVS